MAKTQRTPKRRTPAAKKPASDKSPTLPASVSFDTEAGRRAQGIDTDFRNVHRPRRRNRGPRS